MVFDLLAPDATWTITGTGTTAGTYRSRQALLDQVVSPDLQAKLITHTIADDLGWSEWHWQGNHTNGTELDMRGVVVVGLRENTIAWARLYMEQLAKVVQADILKAA